MSEASGPQARELQALLPFYVNGTLEGEERRRVEAWLERSPEARAEADLLATLRERVKRVSSVEAPGELTLRRTLSAVRREQRVRLRTPGWVKLAVAACLAVIVAQGVALYRTAGGPVDGYATLGGGVEQAALEVTFAPGATELQIRTLLDEADATIVGGPGSLGVYRLSLGGGADAEARARTLELLRSRDIVTHAAEVAP